MNKILEDQRAANEGGVAAVNNKLHKAEAEHKRKVEEAKKV